MKRVPRQRQAHLLAVFAATIASAALADPALRTSVLDAGGGRVAGGAIVIDASLGDVSGIGVDDPVVLKAGYIGQLFDLAGLSVTANPTNVAEQATRQLAAAARYDDDTVGPLDGAVQWSVAWGPLTGVSGSGLATAGAVYQDTGAGARATCDGLVGTVALLVQDVNPDNYGLYAADGVPDAWQVSRFGVDNPNGVAGADPDNDTVPNSGEYAGDTNPSDDTSYLHLTAVAAEGASAVRVTWKGGQLATQVLERSPTLTAPDWTPIYTNLPPTPVEDDHLDAAAAGTAGFYRVRAVR